MFCFCILHSLERRNGICAPSYHFTATENYFKLFISGNSAYINMAQCPVLGLTTETKSLGKCLFSQADSFRS